MPGWDSWAWKKDDRRRSQHLRRERECRFSFSFFCKCHIATSDLKTFRRKAWDGLLGASCVSVSGMSSDRAAAAYCILFSAKGPFEVAVPCHI
jgi:hypothetical protein